MRSFVILFCLSSNFILITCVNLSNLSHVRVVYQFCVASLSKDLSLIHDDNFICQVHEFDGVCHQHSSLVLKNALEDLIEDLFSSVSIQGRNRVIHEDHFRAHVNGSGKTDTSFLST